MKQKENIFRKTMKISMKWIKIVKYADEINGVNYQSESQLKWLATCTLSNVKLNTQTKHEEDENKARK